MNLQKRFAFVVVALTTSFVFGCSCKGPPSASPTATQKDFSATRHETEDKETAQLMAEYKHHQDIQKEYLSDASWLAEKTDDAEARAVSDFLIANVITYINIGSELVTFDQSTKEHPIKLLIITEDELGRLPSLKKLDKNDIFTALFIPDRPLPLMIVKSSENSTSELMRAKTILHEGSHAMHYYSLPSDAPAETVLESALDEVHAYELEHRLLNKLGGKRYTSLVEEQVGLIERRELSMTKEARQERSQKYSEEFADIFMLSDENDIQAIMLEFNLEVGFKFLEQNIPDKDLANNEKADMYIRILSKINIKK